MKSAENIFEAALTLNNSSNGAIEVLKRIVINLGVLPHEIIEQDVNGKRAIVVYRSLKKEILVFERALKKFKIPGLSVTIKNFHHEDWLTKWKEDWKPFRLTSSIDVVPVWCSDDYTFGRRECILLDTISSFGTGLHETTRFMAEFIESLKGKVDNCLDVGTGTGILALVALKNGVHKVTAIDMDAMCIDAAKANLKANGYSGVSVLKKNLVKFHPAQRFDLVCANLVTHDLIAMKDKILSFVKEDGWLAVSGISLENLPILRKGFKELPLKCLKIKKGTQWTAILYKRTQKSQDPRKGSGC